MELFIGIAVGAIVPALVYLALRRSLRQDAQTRASR